MKRIFQFLSFFLLLFGSAQVSAQTINYKQINIQGQLLGASFETTDFEFLVIKLDGDTLYRESHSSVPMSAEGSFTLAFGAGVFLAGEEEDLDQLNWLTADRIELYHVGGGVRYLQGQFNLQAVPYALHSLYLIKAPYTSELEDVGELTYEEGDFFQFNGISYMLGIDELGDTANFVWNADTVLFADTAWFAYNNDFADTAYFAYYADSANYALNFPYVPAVDTSHFVDSAAFAYYSKGNWSINGDLGLTDSHFVGSILEESLIFRTNSNKRLQLGTDFEVNNNFPGDGFRINALSKGLLFAPNVNPGVAEIPGAYVYFEGVSNSFHGGSSVGLIDTLKGDYSFAFGENVGTNGTYSTVFGYNSFGDTAYFGGTTPYPAISSFAIGRNCRVAHMGVAIGDSAIADYYRNIAIGKNVISTSQSSGFAIGNNIYVTGATSWAMGHNLTAMGHFATVIGANASTQTKKGGFLFGDLSTTDTVKSVADNQFIARAAGGVIFYSSGDLSMGVELLPGAGSWSMISDRAKKRNIQLLCATDFQTKFDSFDIYQWNYIGQTTLHIGPMAQDIYGQFKVGELNYYINMIDADGITLLGIKMIYDRLKSLPSSTEINQLEEEINNEKESLDAIEQRINELYEELDRH